MARPPLPLGTWGTIRAYKLPNGSWPAVTDYKDYDGVTVSGESKKSAFQGKIDWQPLGEPAGSGSEVQ
jgi:hypothetical protein